jgi:hypothetical protein
MTVLDGVLAGIERAHPKSPYRSPAVPEPNSASSPKTHRLRRRTASAGSPDLMIGRTFTAG